MRTEKELLVATKAFAIDNRFRSWWHLISTMFLYAASLSICLFGEAWYLRILASFLSALLIVRMFIIYHDFQHHAILVHSRLASAIMQLYGLLVLSPSSVWSRSHDHHHKHNCKDNGDYIGSFPVMTCDQFSSASRWQRFEYYVARHPLTIGLGYLTVFMGGMCVRALFVSPRRHFDSAIAMLLHLSIAFGLYCLGWDYLLLCLILPLMIACGIGSYLFYAQHNFPDCFLDRRGKWSHVRAALQSSSYIQMHPIMRWFTGNVGYHHIHHLNAKIPFYRLPEAMKSLSELQSPLTTSLGLADIYRCFRSNLWDCQLERFVTYSEANRNALSSSIV